MTKEEFKNKTSLARGTMVKMANNEYAALDVLVRIFTALNCGIDDIVEIAIKKWRKVDWQSWKTVRI